MAIFDDVKEGAYRFWRSTIKNFSNNQFTEYTREIAHFNNSKKNILDLTAHFNFCFIKGLLKWKH